MNGLAYASVPSASAPALAHDENEPGMSYDQRAYLWAFPAPSRELNAVHAANQPDSLSKAAVAFPHPVDDDMHSHAAELDRLHTLVGRWSLFLAAVMLIVLLVGQFAFQRTFGPFVVIDIFLCAVFAFGALLLTVYERVALLRLLHIYFALNAIVLIASVPVSIYQLTNNPARIDNFCVDRGGCTADERAHFLTYSYIAGALGLALWFVLSTAFLRTQFVLMCALERAHGQPGAGSIHPAVRVLAAYMPDWAGLVQSCTSRCDACLAAMSENCSTAGPLIFKVVGWLCVAFFFAPLVGLVSGALLCRSCGDKMAQGGAMLGFVMGAGMMLGISSSCDHYQVTGGVVCSTAKVWSELLRAAGSQR